MSQPGKQFLLDAFGRLVRPIVRILLRCGITWREATDVLRGVFVDVARREFGLHGRPTNTSRVSIMTGLGRREVSRIRRALDDGRLVVKTEHANCATRLLRGWHDDPRYRDDDGQPASIPFDADGACFVGLVRAYAADIAPITMLRELTRAGVVTEGPDGRLQPLGREYLPRPIDIEATLRAGSVMRDVGATIDFNLARRPDTPSRFDRRTARGNLAAGDEVAFQVFLEAEGRAFLDRIDDWLRRRDLPAGGGQQARKIRIGAGVYQIHDRDQA